MIGEIFAGAGAFKALVDSVKNLKEMTDTTARADAIMEIQSKLMSIQTSYFVVEGRCREVEAELDRLKKWEADKERYELVKLEPGILMYRIKDAMRGSEPPHEICADCYQKGLKSLLHITGRGNGLTAYKCHACGFDERAGTFIAPRREDSGGWMA